MPQENLLTAVATRLLRIPFWLRRKRPFVAPQNLLIMQPGGLAEILQTTPLLAALHHYFPTARIDWLVNDDQRLVLSGHPQINQILSVGETKLDALSWSHWQQLAQRIQQQRYDTCIIPTASSLLSGLAWRANIPQRVGLSVGGRGVGHTISYYPPATTQHPTEQQLGLIAALGLPPFRLAAGRKMVFYPSDLDRTAVTQRLVEEANWLGDTPLILLNLGGGIATAAPRFWPLERFVLLGNQLVRQFQARLVLVGPEHDAPLARDAQGMMATAVLNWIGQLTLGQLGALCEVADLYIGNDVGETSIAVAADCPTIAIFGPTSPATSGPYAPQGRLATLWHESEAPFTWANGVTIEEVVTASQQLMQ